MSKSSPSSTPTRTVAVSPHTRRAPTRVVLVSSPSIEEPKPPLLASATSPMQEDGYGSSYPSLNRNTGTRKYTDTIADRCMGPDTDDGKNEEY